MIEIDSSIPVPTTDRQMRVTPELAAAVDGMKPGESLIVHGIALAKCLDARMRYDGKRVARRRDRAAGNEAVRLWRVS